MASSNLQFVHRAPYILLLFLLYADVVQAQCLHPRYNTLQ